MKIGGFDEVSLTNGEGLRFVIYTTGCDHQCINCHNKRFWDYNYGVDYDNSYVRELIKKNLPFIDGITLSGGDPLFQPDALYSFLNDVRTDEELHNINIWLYTGYLFNEVPLRVLPLIDVIVDGKYDFRLPSAKWRGSRNQKIWKRFPGTNRFEEMKC